MGVCASKEEKEQIAQSKLIEQALKEDEKRMRDEVKMLLLGTSNTSLINPQELENPGNLLFSSK